MRAVDANILVRLVARDDARQAGSAEKFIAGGAWVSHLVLAETVWVLDAVYERSAEQISTAIEMLLNHQEIALQDPEVVSSALDQFRRRPALGFSDCLVVEIARKAGHMPLGTFDRDLASVDGVQRLK
jgi:predicted nucleic-acid-binding protein